MHTRLPKSALLMLMPVIPWLVTAPANARVRRTLNDQGVSRTIEELP